MTSNSRTGLATAALLSVAAVSPAAGQTTHTTSQSANGVSPAAAAKDEAAIRGTLDAYSAALNDGSTAAVLPLYTEDGIFMPPYSSSAIGRGEVRTAYDKVFTELKFNVKFHIAELVLMSSTYAYVRTNSAGTTAHASTGKTTAEANQELFIFRRGNDGKWRIARYSFSPTNPPSES